jgi:penicillin-binding protein 2
MNRALSGAYPPGSTFKPYMALAALELGKRKADWGFQDPGFFMLGGHRFNDDKPGGHGYINMYSSIVHSCDTYYYQLGNEMGIDAIHDFMKPFGFGQLTGIDLDHEKTGILPSKEWKRERFKKNPAAQKWVGGDTISISIGNGFNTFTPLQMAHAMATLANNGVLMKPHLVKIVEDGGTRARTLTVPSSSGRIPLKQENIDIVKRAMVGVITEGTGAKAFQGAGYTVGGKTGTAQVVGLRGGKYNHHATPERFRDNALFTAFAPADKPRIAIAVIVENAGFGAVIAAPIVRKALDYYLLGKRPGDKDKPKMLKDAPDGVDPEGEHGHDPATIVDQVTAAADVPAPASKG